MRNTSDTVDSVSCFVPLFPHHVNRGTNKELVKKERDPGYPQSEVYLPDCFYLSQTFCKMAHEERFIPPRQKLDQLSVVKDYNIIPRLDYR